MSMMSKSTITQVTVGLPMRLFVLLLWTTNVASLKPNVVFLMLDDVGYGDLGLYGHPTSSTPNIDVLASKGMVFTQFYAGSSMCSPSRASLLTGRLPPRTGVYPRVFAPDSSGGLPLHETTIAQILKQQGYQTAIIGKWHLGIGQKQKYLPTNFGFDHYFGIPYSNNQCPCQQSCFWPDDPCDRQWCLTEFPKCPLFHNDKIIEQPVDLITLNRRYAATARDFIARQSARNRPFFLHYAFQHCHSPQFAGKQFRNSTLRGVYGDSLAEVDWSVGQVLEEIHKQGIADNTFIFFLSDNGPAITEKREGGVAGLLKCGKGTTYEGGQRVPGIAVWPGKIPAGVRTTELASTMDLLPTLAKLTGAEVPSVALDGTDISSVLFTGGKSKRDTFFYYPNLATKSIGVYAVRYRQYKAHFYTEGSEHSGEENPDRDCRPSATLTKHDPPLLFDLHEDPSELYNLNQEGEEYIEILNKIKRIYRKHVLTMDWAESEYLKPTDPDVQPCCSPGCQPFPRCCQCHKAQEPVSFPDKFTQDFNESKSWH
ncbi:arylsulfatase A-like [Ptychodera flava]|uniref:arylsulfatase A-like n=1 Tax=Ptychodera flava TaxID=63121 RepID=UPI00396A2DC3